MKRALAIGIAALGAMGAPSPARTSVLPPPIARPNPATYSIRLDYIEPPRTPTGDVAALSPLLPGVTNAAVLDQHYLAFQVRDDLGGFVPAPVGRLVLAGGGRSIVGGTQGAPQLPLFAQAAAGHVNSFTFTGGAVGPPDNGRRPVPGLGVPPAVPPPTNNNTVPPPNGGFGGNPPPPTTTTTPTPTTPTTTPKPPPPPPTTTTTPPPTTTTTTTTTPSTTTTTAPPTTTTGGGSGSCGTPGLAIDSNLSGCRIFATNMAPGDATSEIVTVKNTSDTTYLLSLRADGTQNRLWQDLRMGVWEQSTAAPSPLPPLLDWTTQFNALTTLHPGESVTYLIELLLPTSAGNADQHLTAVIDFVWRAGG